MKAVAMNNIEVSVGDILFHEKGYYQRNSNPAERYFKILSITLTHVYIQNIRTGWRFNKSVKEVRKEMSYAEPLPKPLEDVVLRNVTTGERFDNFGITE